MLKDAAAAINDPTTASTNDLQAAAKNDRASGATHNRLAAATNDFQAAAINDLATYATHDRLAAAICDRTTPARCRKHIHSQCSVCRRRIVLNVTGLIRKHDPIHDCKAQDYRSHLISTKRLLAIISAW
ncbi:hypothetical protein GJ496_010541 [Pomphorhynchus laevis]|nr:hypothetical protein GJ496_010541 [Pomphorhynchus laevis]